MSTKMNETGQGLSRAARHLVAFPQATRVQQKRRKWPTALLAGVACLAGALSLYAQTEWPWVWIQESPSIPPAHKCGQPYVMIPVTHEFRVGCYDVSTGHWLNCETLWREYFSLEGVGGDQLLVWNGGHEHDRSSGDFEKTIGTLYCALDQGGGGDPSTFHGFTNNQVWYAVKSMPEASGVIRMSGMYTAPSGWSIVPNSVWHLDPTDPTQRRGYCEAAYLVQVTGLTELPDNPALYKKQSNPGAHAAGKQFYGTPGMIQKLTQLARQYQDWYYGEYGAKVEISFNDMSLIYGGLYDYTGNWNCPHLLHRLGRSADVNHGQVGSADEVDDDRLDIIAGQLGLSRYEKNIGLIHYELR